MNAASLAIMNGDYQAASKIFHETYLLKRRDNSPDAGLYRIAAYVYSRPSKKAHKEHLYEYDMQLDKEMYHMVHAGQK